MKITKMTAAELGKKIQAGEVGVAEAVQASLAECREKEKLLHAYITIDEEQALRQAEAVQKEIMKGNLNSPLAGVPVAVKDNICVKGMPTTCASRMLEYFTPAYEATAVEQLRKAGAIILGKTNMDEFAMGSTTETSAFGVTRNPWNTEHVPGGSSGGSCAAVSANEAFFALGSDTGGSIRQPASFCGVAGLKPTYGSVSRYGLVAYASSLDQIGPIGKDVTDCALALQTIASHDKKDSTSIQRKNDDFESALQKDVRGMKIGIPKAYIDEGLDGEVREAVLGVANKLEEVGAEVSYFDLNLTEYAVAAYYIIASAEASSNLARFDGVKYGYRSEHYEGLHEMYKKSRSEGFGAEAKRRIMLGSFVLSAGYYDAYYLRALRAKAMIKEEFQKAFETYDVILAPAAPTAAPRLGESLTDPMRMYLSDVYTVSVNLAGLPAMSVPCGMTAAGLPIGVQLIGNYFCEHTILRAAYTYEQVRGDWTKEGQADA